MEGTAPAVKGPPCSAPGPYRQEHRRELTLIQADAAIIQAALAGCQQRHDTPLSEAGAFCRLCGPPCRVNKQGDVGVTSVEGKLFFVLVRQDKDTRCSLSSKVPATWHETPSRVQISSFPGL